jgi:hypothetical protein
VKSLLRKHEKAVDGRRDTKTAFHELTETISPDLIGEWTALEKKAMLERGDLLKIFDVKEDNGENTGLKHCIYTHGKLSCSSNAE